MSSHVSDTVFVLSRLDYRKFRTLKWNWFPVHVNVTMCFLFLQALHWLLVQARIDYKLSVICRNFFSDSSPSDLSDLRTVYTPSKQLRSSEDARILRIPHVKKKNLLPQLFPTVFRSNGILSLLTSVTFNPLMPSKLREKLTATNNIAKTRDLKFDSLLSSFDRPLQSDMVCKICRRRLGTKYGSHRTS